MKKKELDKYLNEAINNIHEDRQVTKDLLKDVMRFLAVEETAHSKVGPVAAKYVETLQRSNEQLVKIIGLRQKEQTSNDLLSEKDKDSLFDLIQREPQ